MNTTCLAQHYLLLTMNRQGKISSFNYYTGICLVMAGLLDLQKAGIIQLDRKEILVLKDELPEELGFLDSLLEKIMSLKHKRIDRLAVVYGGTFFEKDLKQLTVQIRQSLMVREEICVMGDNNYLAEEKTIAKLVARLENLNQLDHDGIALAILLKKSSHLNRYIERKERKVLEAKIKAAKKEPVSQQTQTMITQLDWLMGSLVAVSVI